MGRLISELKLSGRGGGSPFGGELAGKTSDKPSYEDSGVVIFELDPSGEGGYLRIEGADSETAKRLSKDKALEFLKKHLGKDAGLADDILNEKPYETTNDHANKMIAALKAVKSNESIISRVLEGKKVRNALSELDYDIEKGIGLNGKIITIKGREGHWLVQNVFPLRRDALVTPMFGDGEDDSVSLDQIERVIESR